ncbi:uncharacterized protein N7518_005539 [Penicillium psychrosexuale]|uniref:uncharacterized protein n=1 Tax=Penicillium roqueforti TaxID=5082 RepID=UPI00190DE007|nr:uncharacterized protein LCP9604111_3420 [Penicillium roqueforti]XP_057043236.1 uncharacterized protein N7518_005539 [Penicillium psychrosexuale]KAF9250518.1 hypothetical protein LCP9604111_3420 [Penicillium roqueforti]KAI2698857.1 hypothetical protein CBS147372_6704 [Penicillium roqueforti]KAI3129594.1 hypothetical protein CBS147330_5224 [Penicillium roqueforti]KAI3133201.1 hypothetical protein CBS147326_5004 [Penicillium roqueforti]KAI3152688.1 hypothetical protein CBS147317_7066 [Penicil
MSTRSIRKPRRLAPEIPDAAVQHAAAAAAASRAMRSSQGSSQDSKSSYERLGGPGNFAIPRRRHGSSLRSTDDGSSVGQGDLPKAPNPRHSKELTGVSARAHCFDDPAALPPITELDGLDGRDSSVPSSYRRLRKAKSMFSTSQRTSQTPYGVPTLPCSDPLDPERSPGFQLPRTMRRSMSFLRGSYQSNQVAPTSKGHDAAIQLARSQFAQDPDAGGVQTRRPSFLLRRKKEHRPFRKSFRATSESGVDTGRSLKSRSFSNSIKNKFKRVFGFSRLDQQPGSPDASMVTPVRKSIERFSPNKVTAIGDGTDSNYFRPMPQSPSQESLCTSKSRVTSWADSTTPNTVTTRKLGHRQSLSLIREDGVNQQIPRTPTMDDTENQSPLAVRANPHRISIVDSQDLYTALMKQMGQNSLPNPNEDMVFGNVSQHRVIPERANSVYSQHGRRSIRHVPSQESSTSPGSFATARGGDQSSPRKYPRSVRSMQVSRGMPSQVKDQHMTAVSDAKSPQSAYAFCEESDDDNCSVIVSRLRASTRDIVSPSVYSRTTSGNTPTRTDNTDIGVHDEPGTATIFTSQRTTYSSPKRTNRASSSTPNVKSSADWQQWMSSQIERIEQASPTREHIRECAQYQDDDEYFISIARRAPVAVSAPGSATVIRVPDSQSITERKASAENRIPSQSNFSRPLTQASGMRTIMPLQTTKSENMVQSYANSLSLDTAAKSGENDSPKSIPVACNQQPSPIRLRSGNMQPPESPTPKGVGAKRSLTKEQQRRYSSRRAPISQDNRINHFRSMRTQRDNRANNENVRQQYEYNDMMENYHQLQDIHSTVSSKRMVDMFLDSRRRQMGEVTDNDTTTEAFL